MDVYSHNKLSDLLKQRDGDVPLSLCFTDHIGGFSSDFHNIYFDKLESFGTNRNIYYDCLLEDSVHDIYDNLNIQFKLNACEDMQNLGLITSLFTYDTHPDNTFDNFICSFNGSDDYGRQFLVSMMYRHGWFNTDYCSKNFISSYDRIDGNLEHFLDKDDIEMYRKLIIGSGASDNFASFLNNTNGFSFNKSAYDYRTDITHIENKITSSFVHLVSESMMTSYHPYITEKAFYSIVSRGLYITYGQPGWHRFFEKYYGFKKYDKIFDYSFDEITNPIKRLVEIFTMLYKFSFLSEHDWHDLYLMEQDTIDYNYEHYFSKNFLNKLSGYEEVQ